MTIGILFESHEWSSIALRDYIQEEGIEVKLIDLEENFKLDNISKYYIIVNRVFASAQFRGHHKSLVVVEKILEEVKDNNIELINSYQAHFYEVSKELSTNKLASLGFSVPEIYDSFTEEEDLDYDLIQYPCVMKPDCGGRTNYTYILEDQSELRAALEEVENCELKFIIQQYIPPVKGYITRMEVVANECYSVLKRYVVEGGLSAYNLGSDYDSYQDCPPEIINTALEAMEELDMELGSLDIIESKDDFYIIDVNSVSNFAPENIEMFGFNLIKDTAHYIVKRYKQLLASDE